MHSTFILLAGLAALTSAAPFVERDPDIFQVSNFIFGCTTTCDWYYDITVTNNAANHPSTQAVYCQGSTETQSFDSTVCDHISDSQQLSTYIDKDNKLQIQYKFENVSAGDTWWYEGSTPVNAETSGKPQAKTFSVPETKAYGVA